MQFSRWSCRSLFAFSYFRLPAFLLPPKILIPFVAPDSVSHASFGSFRFFQQPHRTFSSVPVAQGASFDEIKAFMRKELTVSQQDYEACYSANWFEKEQHDHFIKLVQSSLKELEACKEEAALKKLFQNKPFHAILDKHTHLEVSHGQNSDTKSLSWEEARQKMSLLIRRGLSCPKPGIYG